MDQELQLAVDEHIKLALDAYQGKHGVRPSIVQETIMGSWVGTFVYQRSNGESPLCQNILEFVCKHRPGPNPRLGDPWMHGAYNYNLEIKFDDGSALFRFPIPGVVAFPDDKIRAEVATIRYIDEHTSIPVPHIYHWGSAADNPTGFNVPFIIMEHIPHATTVSQALKDPDFSIPAVPHTEKREYLYRQMADICLQLYNLTSDRIGSLGILDSGAYTIDTMPLTHVIAQQVVNCRVPVSVLPSRRKTYSTSQEYLVDIADMKVAELLFMPKEFIESPTDCERQFAARYLLRQAVMNSNEGRVDSNGLPAKSQPPREIFRLWSDDFRPGNVLLDDAGVVVGVIDWEYTYFAPESYTLNPPWWLYNEFLDEDSDSETGSSEAFDEPGEAAGGDCSPAEAIQEQWKQAVGVYLRALEKTEERQQESHDSQSPGHFLGSSPDPQDSQLFPTAEQLPRLSQRMRHRWTSEKAEYALMSAVSSEVLFDKYLWDYIDQSRLDRGEAAVEDHDERLRLVSPRAKTLLDGFAQLGIREKQGEQPELLLDRILARMGGA